MTLTFSDDLIRQTKLTESELRRELALRLFETERLSFGQARRLAGVDVITFQQLLARNRIPLHYDVADFEQDLKKPLP
jgi:predicted HTH domain antitoxin